MSPNLYFCHRSAPQKPHSSTSPSSTAQISGFKSARFGSERSSHSWSLPFKPCPWAVASPEKTGTGIHAARTPAAPPLSPRCSCPSAGLHQSGPWPCRPRFFECFSVCARLSQLLCLASFQVLAVLETTSSNPGPLPRSRSRCHHSRLRALTVGSADPAQLPPTCLPVLQKAALVTYPGLQLRAF